MKFILTFAIAIILLYSIIGWKKIFDRYKMYSSNEYWTNYNTIELAAWMAKAIILPIRSRPGSRPSSPRHGA